MAAKATSPAGLGTAGLAMWQQITKDYELRTDELAILEEACRERDLIVALDTELQAVGVMATGSMGQQVVHPLVQEIRQHRTTLGGLLKSLKLPDETKASTPGERSSAARAAANARWSQRGA